MPKSDFQKQANLRKMKLTATILLLAVLVIFLFCLAVQKYNFFPGSIFWIKYLQAAAEAGMVGGLADWFAVTALFKHPLGLPIPHTAIIPRKKTQLGSALAEFVNTNFLTPKTVTDRIYSAKLPLKISNWMQQEKNQLKIALEINKVLAYVLKRLNISQLTDLVNNFLLTKLTPNIWAPILGEQLNDIVNTKKHEKLIDILLQNVLDWLTVNSVSVTAILVEKAPTWMPKIIKNLITDRLYSDLMQFGQEILLQKDHPARKTLDNYLYSLSFDLQHDIKLQKKLIKWQNNFINSGKSEAIISSLNVVLLENLTAIIADPESKLNTEIKQQLAQFADNLAKDIALQAKINTLLVAGSDYVIENYSSELVLIITDTINRWDAKTTAQKLELNVGRDLQFIRINGTLVGSIVGLVIYTFGQILFG